MHIFFSVGEPSGDQHAAELIDELRHRQRNVRISGFGGPLMERAGCERLYPLTDIAVMGFFRILPLLWTFYKLIRQADQFLARERPDAVILIDIPGFNWWIARKAKSHGIPVFYFLPPQLWAWAPWRIEKVRRFVDHVLSGLSFEVEWYRRRGIACEFVGHPFFDEVARHRLDKAYLAALDDEHAPLVGLLPGSRAQEVRGNFPIMLEVVRRLQSSHPQARYRVACYKDVQREMCCQMLADAIRRHPSLGEVSIVLDVDRTPEIIEAVDCCLIVSGSVSLELLARRTPAVVVYHGTWWLMVLRWIFVTCKYVTLPNLMAGREIMPEFVFSGSYDGPSAQMAGILSRWLSDESERAATVAELDALAASVAQTGGIARAAEYVLERIAPLARQKAA
jgi:lipid-A-disaccharide synthase